MNAHRYTNCVLTLIALLLAWHAFVREPAVSVHAQPRHAYRAVLLPFLEREASSTGAKEGPLIPFEKRLNEAAQGDRLVSMITSEDGFAAIAVFAQENER